MRLSKWTITDNSGMLYPLILTLSTQSNFEFCVTLQEAVNPLYLLSALEKTYERFAFTKVELQNNLFRSCLVENNHRVVIHQNSGKLLGRINFAKNNNYLIEVSYIDNEIHFKFFHSIADGNGAMVFIKYLLIEYAKLTGSQIDNDNVTVKNGENENAYQRYLDKNVEAKGLISSAKSASLQVKGKYFMHDGLAYISGEIDLKKALEVSHKYNCSLTVFIGAVAMLTVNELYGNGKKSPSLFIPVNLRKYFPSNTLLNFVSSAKCILPPEIKDLENTIELLSSALNNELKEENLKKALYLASTVANNPFTKFCPFFLKRELITFGRELVTTGTQTMILSNIGNVILPDGMDKVVKNINFFLNCNRRTPVNLSIGSFNGILSVCFTRHIVEKKIEKAFFEKMRDLGLDFEIHSNYREH